MCSSFLCQNTSSGSCSRLCLVPCLSICFWACLCLSPCLSSSAELLCLSPGPPPGVVTFFFELPGGEFLRLPFVTFLRAEATSCDFTSSCTGDAVVTIFFTKDETCCSSNCSGRRFESSSLVFLLRLSDVLQSFHVCPLFLSRHVRKLSSTIRQRTVRSPGPIDVNVF